MPDGLEQYIDHAKQYLDVWFEEYVQTWRQKGKGPKTWIRMLPRFAKELGLKRTLTTMVEDTPLTQEGWVTLKKGIMQYFGVSNLGDIEVQWSSISQGEWKGVFHAQLQINKTAEKVLQKTGRRISEEDKKEMLLQWVPKQFHERAANQAPLR